MTTPNLNMKTLRLVFPQWQGGNNPPYHLGAHLLNWLAPAATGPTEEVPVDAPDAAPLQLEEGIIARRALLRQLEHAQSIIARHQPDRITVIGGDCLVDLAPFAYLNERYEDDLAVLWVDTHPDIMTPAQFQHAHAMVLGNLLGHGDPDFASAVRKPLKASNVLLVGMHDPSVWEAEEIKRLGLRHVSPSELSRFGNQAILDWFQSTGAKHLAIHFDLDALDPKLFRALLFARPGATADSFGGAAEGELSIDQVVSLLGDMSNVADVVGMGITEHIPWDALALQGMLARLPLIGSPAE